MDWSVYIICCDDGSLYTGISTDVERRFREHLETPREAAIKKLSRGGKLRLIRQNTAMLD